MEAETYAAVFKAVTDAVELPVGEISAELIAKREKVDADLARPVDELL